MCPVQTVTYVSGRSRFNWPYTPKLPESSREMTLFGPPNGPQSSQLDPGVSQAGWASREDLKDLTARLRAFVSAPAPKPPGSCFGSPFLATLFVKIKGLAKTLMVGRSTRTCLRMRSVPPIVGGSSETRSDASFNTRSARLRCILFVSTLDSLARGTKFGGVSLTGHKRSTRHRIFPGPVRNLVFPASSCSLGSMPDLFSQNSHPVQQVCSVWSRQMKGGFQT
jgi:hypothetical protein